MQPGVVVAGTVDHRQPRSARRAGAQTLIPTSRPGRPVVDTGLRSSQRPVMLVADPMRDSRERLVAGLADSGRVRVIEADTLAAVDAMTDGSEGGQLALVSLSFGTAAPRLIQDLCRAGWSRVMVVTMSGIAAPILAAMDAGASGVLRSHPATVDPHLPDRLGKLTARELEILELVADGRSNKWIADHLSRFSRKLGTGDRSHQVAVAIRAGMLN